jgi:hypothetical protein
MTWVRWKWLLGVFSLGGLLAGISCNAWAAVERAESATLLVVAQKEQEPLQKPYEKRKENNLDQVQNALAQYNREIVRLAQRAENENTATQSAFKRAQGEFVEKSAAVRKILTEVSSLTPQAVRGRKHELDVSLKAAERAYTKALAVFP